MSSRLSPLRVAASSLRTTQHRSKHSLADVRPGDIERARLQAHYTNTLSHDLLYLLYSHSAHSATPPSPLLRTPTWSPANPYAANRAPPRPKGGRHIVPNPAYTSPTSVPALESIVLQTMTKSALSSKSALLPLLLAYSAISGETLATPTSPTGITITHSSRASASFKIRPGQPTGCKLELRGQPMYALLDTLQTFVLPRLKTFTGIPLPPASTPPQSPSSNSGVVAFGLPPEAMALWPQIEANLDQYPRMYGMNLFFRTTAKGRGAQNQARALLSGLGLPFVKR